MSPGRTWAYVGAVMGGVASVAANVAHSWVPASGASVGWEPEPGAVIAAAFWPLALLVAVEVLVRVEWPAGRWMAGLRFAGVGMVAVVAAVVSYRHLSGLLDHYGEDPITVVLGPLAIDGLMLVSTAALLATVPIGSTPDDLEIEPTAPLPIGSTPDPIPSIVGPAAFPPVAGPTRSDDPIGSGPVEPIDSIGTPIGDSIPHSIGSDGSGRSIGSDQGGSGSRSDRVGSTRSSAGKQTRSGQGGRPAHRSDDVLRIELTKAQGLGLVPKVNPSAESIRQVLQVSPKKARQLRDELKSESGKADAEQADESEREAGAVGG